MNKKEIIFSVLIILSLSTAVWSKLSTPKIAYIRTSELLEGYAGMKEASEVYEQKQHNWIQLSDSLTVNLNVEMENYKSDSNQYTRKEKIAKKEKIRNMQYQLARLQENIRQKATDEDERMTMIVVNQVNSFIDKYGKENGYDVILGTLETGSVLFGTNKLDITEDVLMKLNNSYLGNDE